MAPWRGFCPGRLATAAAGRTAAFWRPVVRRPASRRYSTEPPPSSSSSSPVSRAERILARLPPSMQKYTRRLKDAPVSHVVAFLILHEITAIVPLLGLFGLFHYAAGSGGSGSRLVPLDYMLGHYGGQVAEGVRRFETYFRRKGWFGFGDDAAEDTTDGTAATATAAATTPATATVLERWTSADAKYKIVVEVGLAYAITKVLLPVRIAASLWATPWFAGVLARVRSRKG